MVWNVDIFNEMDRLRREMNNLMSNYETAAGSAATFPSINVYDGKDSLIVSAELPGLTKDQVSIVYSDGMLTLSGNREPVLAAKKLSALRKERPEGKFEKSLRIPVKIDQNGISASFTNGILTISLPKAEEAKPKTIKIEA
ncbi:MAG: Hsp20/alpha crystallin family protein [Fibrobacter sp.]|nr:Hsp20/alpha crystallin family protein [Fibrobacter sp.]